MIIQIEPNSDIPIYTQLTNQIIEGIVRGKIRPGDSLPSVRAFAADLGVNMHTVNKSYHELEKKGIIRIVPKSGAIIRSTEEMDNQEIQFKRIESELKPMLAEALVLGMEKVQIQELILSIVQDLKNEV
ncbi:GntR family transcriptional regulator [Heyndrickxia sporothermodurans]|nr:GntR family transcriptional regulator [Heyndrickxia sporothermodurans]